MPYTTQSAIRPRSVGLNYSNHPLFFFLSVQTEFAQEKRKKDTYSYIYYYVVNRTLCRRPLPATYAEISRTLCSFDPKKGENNTQ